MAKFTPKVMRKDAMVEAEHAHKLPDGTFTGPSLYKPNHDRSFPHTHLYKSAAHSNAMLESGIAEIGDAHVHCTEMGDTGGPVPVPKDPGEKIPRDHNDSVTKEWNKWVRRSPSGEVLKTGKTRMDAMEPNQFEKDELEAETAAKKAVGDVDEGKWQKAKEASKKEYGHVKWPVVQHIYQNMGVQ